MEKRKSKHIGLFFGVFTNIRQWVSYDELAHSSRTVLSLVKRLFSYEQSVRKETYDEAVQRMSLSHKHLEQRKKVFKHSAYLYALLGLIILIYLVFLLSKVKLMAAFFATILFTIVILNAYREHFWYMQMEKRQLGCNFQDWLNFISRGVKDDNKIT